MTRTPHPLRRASLVAFVALLAVAVGCSSNSAPRPAEGRTMPKGRILANGLPVSTKSNNLPPGDPGMKVTFIKVGGSEAGQEIDAQITDAATCTFELIGSDAKGIPPGKYRVAVSIGPEGGTDVLKGKYSRDKSKIEVEVKPGEDLIIDLANYK